VMFLKPTSSARSAAASVRRSAVRPARGLMEAGYLGGLAFCLVLFES
jgi:hypothetical protein